MGSVWRAHHLTLDTQVAVKFIHDDLVRTDASLRERFVREARASAKLKSPHVVQVFDQGVTDEGMAYIVMELLEGESLDARLDRVGRLSMRQTTEVVSQAALALGAAHRAGIIHRDIKPENIFLVPVEDGKFVKVLDFGIAKQAATTESRKLTMDGMLIGTPEYICRDLMVDPNNLNHHADIWALAIVAYECLTGTMPFGGATIGVICARIMSGKFDPPSKVRPDLSPDVDAWFAKALHVDKKQRFRSARELALHFAKLLGGKADDSEDNAVHNQPFSEMPDSVLGTQIGLAAPRHDCVDDTAQLLDEALIDDDRDSDVEEDRPSPGSFSGSSADLVPSGVPMSSQRGPWLAACALAAAAVVVGTVVWLSRESADATATPTAAEPLQEAVSKSSAQATVGTAAPATESPRGNQPENLNGPATSSTDAIAPRPTSAGTSPPPAAATSPRSTVATSPPVTPAPPPATPPPAKKRTDSLPDATQLGF